MQNNPINSVKSAFTLIELLVVIAIISLLAAILFPLFGRARESARRSSCQSNLKQISLGIAQYSQDYDEDLPLYQGGGGGNSWDDQTNAYVKNRSVYACPSDSMITSTGNKRSYSFNCTDAPATGTGTRPMNYQDRAVTIASIEDTAGTIMVTERPNPASHFGGVSVSEVKCPAGTAGGANPQLEASTGLTTPIHFDGWNYLFCDGHVKFLLPARTLGPTDALSTTTPKGMWTTTFGD